MKYFTWIGTATAGVVSIVIYWTNRQTDLAVAPVAEPQVAVTKPCGVGPTRLRTVAVADIIEPIPVLPEWEVAPLPIPVADLDNELGVVLGIQHLGPIRVSDAAITPRPEAGQVSRPWMPYAPEDRELSDTRRLEWTKLATLEAAPANFEETAEPPLLEKKDR